jgi:hypothetical protein
MFTQEYAAPAGFDDKAIWYVSSQSFPVNRVDDNDPRVGIQLAGRDLLFVEKSKGNFESF